MSESALRAYANSILGPVPLAHWVVIGLLSLALTLFLVFRLKCTVYSAICMGITVSVGMILLDTAVLARWCEGVNHVAGINLSSEYHRLIHGGNARLIEMLANVTTFVPFGFFLSEFHALVKRSTAGRRLGLVTIIGFGLSLCIECLQLVLCVGFFELTDLVMNTLGGFSGACLAVYGRTLMYRRNNRYN